MRKAAATQSGFNNQGRTDKDMVLLEKDPVKTAKLLCLHGSHLVMCLEPLESVCEKRGHFPQVRFWQHSTFVQKVYSSKGPRTQIMWF